MDQLAKMHRRRWKEHHKIDKVAKFESDIYSWFSRDVTKILKSKPAGLQNFYLLLRKDYLKIYLFTIP